MECRLCLCSVTKETSVTIRDDDNTLKTRIHSCCQLQKSLHDILPKRICLSCESNVERFDSFKRMCLQSEDTARLRLKESTNIKIEEVMLDDVVFDTASVDEQEPPMQGDPREDRDACPTVELQPESPDHKDMAVESPQKRKRRLARDRQERWRLGQRQKVIDMMEPAETPEDAASRRAAHAHYERLRLQTQTPEQIEAKRTARAFSERSRLQLQTPEQLEIRRAAHAQSERLRLQSQTPEQIQTRRAAHARSERLRRQSLTPEQNQAQRIAHARSEKLRVQSKTPEKMQTRQIATQSDAMKQAENRQVQQSNAQQSTDLQLIAQFESIFEQPLIIKESPVIEHHCGMMNAICGFCLSKNFDAERPFDGKFTSCCRKGKLKLEKPVDKDGNVLQYPDFLRELISNPEHPHYAHFRKNIRSYNSEVSFASMGAKVSDFHGGLCSIKIHGQIYHLTFDPPSKDHKAPQIYVIDGSQATLVGNKYPVNNENCLPLILNEIDSIFHVHNKLVMSYRMLRDLDVQSEKEAKDGVDIPTVNLVFKQSDTPIVDEIAMVFVNRNGEPPLKRDIRVYPIISQNPRRLYSNLSSQSRYLDSMSYPILFPYGENGWQPHLPYEPYEGSKAIRERVNITMLQYKAAQLAIRDKFNPLISAGKLTQQWIVDSFVQIEANNINFNNNNQYKKNLRGDILLESTSLRVKCADAMAIFAKFGTPDIYLTFTANPKWSEISDNLQVGERPLDRPDLIVRVFKIKLKALMKDLTLNNTLGQSINYVYNIDFHSGLPHAHILITLRAADKLTNADQIDRIVFTEIPDQTKNPRLHYAVTEFMMHGPCGSKNPKAVCMKNGKCNKGFPKEYRVSTVRNVDGYPLYRRPKTLTAQINSETMDSRFVVSYNPYLLIKYKAHISVEACTSTRAMNHIYKYIYRGFNFTNMIISAGNNPQLALDKVDNSIDVRYVSPTEAMWRILEFPVHNRSHTVASLPIHLPNQNPQEESSEAPQQSTWKLSKLEAWFALNASSPDARDYFYTDIPKYYRWINNNKWQIRKQVAKKILSRIFSVRIADEEQFYLRLMLLHIPGATSFEFIRTVDGTTYDTFKIAAMHRNLLASDEEWDRCLRDVSACEKPIQMRQIFAYICCYSVPANALQMWNKYCLNMSLDYRQLHCEFEAFNLTLLDMNSTLEQHELSCEAVGLPLPRGDPIQIVLYDRVQEEQKAERQIKTFNPQQLDVFHKVLDGIYNESETHRYLFVSGLAGSGKTYLNSTLLSYVQGKGDIALSFATTEIAATLLSGGQTVQSGFKLPAPVLDTSTSSMGTDSPEAETLRRASLIIIDEVTMLTKYEFDCIDELLRKIMQKQEPFGGKVMVITGDFRQTLPVYKRGTCVDVIKNCIRSSKTWDSFKLMMLTVNMRSKGQNSYNTWLSNIGSGHLPQIAQVPQNSVELPYNMIENENLIEAIYGKTLTEFSTSEIIKRIILAPTDEDILNINKKIIEKLPGELYVFYSADSIESEDPEDANNYPPEFIHNQTPSGMPPHKLELKIGTIVMLLRNLNPKRGLCSGKRLLIKSLQKNLITAEIISGNNSGDIVFLSRIDLSPSDVNLPFILKRRQFPIIPAYAITIDGSRGQTFDYVGIHLNEPVFTHGQLYIALSRSRKPENTKVYIIENRLQGKLLKNDKIFTQNIVNREIFLQYFIFNITA